MSRSLRTLPLFLLALATACGGSDGDPNTGGGADNGVLTDTVGGGTGGQCQDQCPAESLTECTAGGVRACEDTNDDGCVEWSAVVACPAGQACESGRCVVNCPAQECTAVGADRCEDDGTIVECGDYNADGCLEWGNPVSCAEGLVCSNGFCAINCSNECTVIGAKRCDGSSVVTCGDYNNDGCLEWGSPADCGGLVCSNGFCRSQCTNECTAPESKRCEGNGTKTCGDYNNDGCLEWGTVLACGQDQVCSNGACTDSCSNECTVPGARSCELNSVITCGDYNGDGCLEWGTPSACDEGLVCNGGFCESDCADGCTVRNARRCDEGGNVQTCDDHDDDPCLEWGSGVACADPLVCALGNCESQCQNACSVKNERACVPGSASQFQTCDDYNGDGCLEWGTGETCDEGLVCSGNGNCAVGCESTCAVADERRCDGESGYEVCGDYNGDGCLEWGTPVFCEVSEVCTDGACGQAPPPATIVISEVLFDSDGSPDTDSFTELQGPAGTPLDGFVLVGVNGLDGSDYASIPLVGQLGDDGLFVVAHPDAADAIADMADQTDPKVDFQNGPDNIELRFGATVVDALGYGDFSGGEEFRGEGSPASKPPAGRSLARDLAYTDTDDNSVDFTAATNPTAGGANVQLNERPAAVLSCPASGLVDEALTFDASGSSDTDGTITTYQFAFGDGTAPLSSASPTAQHTYVSFGEFIVTLTVTDDGGETDTTTCSLNIGDESVPNVAIIKPIDNKQVTQGDTVTILVDATAAAGRDISQVELLVDGALHGVPDAAAPYEFVYDVPANAATDSAVSLQARATDSLGSVGFSPVRSLQVRNDVPVASFTVVVSGELTVTLDATASSDSESDDALLEVRWDFTNDGTWDTDWSVEKVIEHVYNQDGSYDIKMQVRDGIGQTASTVHSVTLSSIEVVFGEITTTAWSGTKVVTGDLHVPSGETLTITAGTNILFTATDQNGDDVGDYDLQVDGALVVNGTEQRPVIFTSFAAEDKHPRAWNRIRLDGADSHLQHVVIEYADVGLSINDNAVVEHATVQQSRMGIEVASSADATVANSLITAHTSHGVRVTGGRVAFAGSTISSNGDDGVYVTNGTFDLRDSTVQGNEATGVEYLGRGGGLLTQNRVLGNHFEGVRIATDGSNDPNPILNYNNIFGNALVGARVVEDVGSSIRSSGRQTVTGDDVGSPSGEIVDLVRFTYAESDYYNDIVGSIVAVSPGSGSLSSYSGARSGWAVTTELGADRVAPRVASTNSSSSYYGSMTLSRAAWTQADAVRELSVITSSRTIDAKHNFFGGYPGVLSVVALGEHNNADIQGFLGVPFDDAWQKGPYVGGEALTADVEWTGEIFVTGDLMVGEGTTLTIVQGTEVQFVAIDQDADGVGDYGVRVAGSLAVNGASGDPVVFSSFGTAKSPGSWDKIEVSGAGATSSLTHCRVEYADTGLRLTSGTHVLRNVTSRLHRGDGLLIQGATSVDGDYLTSQECGGDGVEISQSRGVTLNHLEATANAEQGLEVHASSSVVSTSDCTITANGRAGIRVVSSAVDISYCTIKQNQRGVIWRGSATGSLTLSDIQFNEWEGILLQSDSGHPGPSLTSNNIFSNAVDKGAVLADPGLSIRVSGRRTENSEPWVAPDNEPIRAFRYSYAESDYYNDIVGRVLSGADSATLLTTSGARGATIVQLDDGVFGGIVASVSSTNSSSSYYGQTTIDLAYHLAAGPTTELTALTDSGTVSCQENYWGVFPDITPRIALARTDAINFDGRQANEIAGTGPR